MSVERLIELAHTVEPSDAIRMLAIRCHEAETALQAERKLRMTGGDSDQPECTVEEFEAIIAEACTAGATPVQRAGILLAAWRTWFGQGGPGLFDRLRMADDMKRVIEAAIAETKQ